MHRRSGGLAQREEFGPFEPDEVAAEAFPKRVRARWADRWVLDTDRASIAWIEGPTPDYAIPSADVDVETEIGEAVEDERLGTVEPITLVAGEARQPDAGVRIQEPPKQAQRLRDHVVLDWDAVDAWFVEDERQRGHPRDPYHRIDVHATSRPVEVSVGGQTIASSERALAVFETRLPFRFYLPPTDVDLSVLEGSDTRTVCAYKGQATYYHVDTGSERVEDAAWAYPSPEPRFGRVQDRICFHQEKVDMRVADTDLL
jgi:uncharacterized protein (DUF427 family)